MTDRHTTPPGDCVRVEPDGRLTLQGIAADLASWLDARVERLAVRAGAERLAPPDRLAPAVLERTGYSEAFPGMAVPLDAARSGYHPPAACHHVYAALDGARLARPAMYTLSSACAREEQRTACDPGRLRHFHMREVVFVGPAAWVEGNREAWMRHATGLAAEMGLSAMMEAAQDPFFGDAGRGRRLLQQLKELKFELRADAGAAGEVALASFNLHETFFATRFDFGMADGTAAASGCAAFGLERWTLACLARLGPAGAARLMDGGGSRSTTNI